MIAARTDGTGRLAMRGASTQTFQAVQDAYRFNLPEGTFDIDRWQSMEPHQRLELFVRGVPFALRQYGMHDRQRRPKAFIEDMDSAFSYRNDWTERLWPKMIEYPDVASFIGFNFGFLSNETRKNIVQYLWRTPERLQSYFYSGDPLGGSPYMVEATGDVFPKLALYAMIYGAFYYPPVDYLVAYLKWIQFSPIWSKVLAAKPPVIMDVDLHSAGRHQLHWTRTTPDAQTIILIEAIVNAFRTFKAKLR